MPIECQAMRSFTDLKVRQKSHELSLSVYKLPLRFPKEESYGLIGQLRRAASSVLANIAGGCGCNGNREVVCFGEIALQSAGETQYI